MRRETTIGDLCALTGYSRDQLRGLMAELPRFAERASTERVARIFSNHDVLLLVLLCRLETVYGLKRSAVARMSEPIATTLSIPRNVSGSAKLTLHTVSGECNYVEDMPALEDGLVVPLGPVFSMIDAYLAPTPFVQREMGLSALTSETKGSRPSSGSRRSASHG
jgi:hypothetical protein